MPTLADVKKLADEPTASTTDLAVASPRTPADPAQAEPKAAMESSHSPSEVTPTPARKRPRTEDDGVADTTPLTGKRPDKPASLSRTLASSPGSKEATVQA